MKKQDAAIPDNLAPNKVIVTAPPIYNIHSIAQLFNVTERTVYRWIKGEYLPARKVGHRWVSTLEDVHYFVEHGLAMQQRTSTEEGKDAPATVEAEPDDE